MSARLFLQKIVNLAVVVLLLGSLTLSASASDSRFQAGGVRVPNVVVPDDGPIPPRLPNVPIPEKDFTKGKPGAAIEPSDTAGLMALGDTLVPVSILLDKPSLARAANDLTGEQRQAYAAEVAAYQDQIAAQVEAAGGKVLYRFKTLSSGLIAEMPGKAAEKVAAIPGIERIARIYDYQKDLSETVAHIGADAVKILGYTGDGVTVAVLDSGIDYTHKAFSGPGTVAAWEAAYWGPDADCRAAFGRIPGCANSQAPAGEANFGAMSQVKGGYDWVGPAWSGLSGTPPLMPDPNPIANRSAANGDNGTHGTHVADIIAGQAFSDGTRTIGEGVAPDADLYAFTVCSQVSTACSGVAMLQGLDDAADLDNNPFTNDPADVLNLSLGSNYGQPEDDATFFINELVAYGSIVVTSAGNGGDIPYIVGSPSTASGAISVAQTTVPSAVQYVLEINTTPVTLAYKPAFQPWSVPVTSVMSGEVAYDTTSAATRLGCTNADGDSPWSSAALFENQVLLVDRGVCSASRKAANGFAAGAKMVIIAMVAPMDPYTFAYDGGDITGPVFSVTQDDGLLIKNNLVENITVSVDPADNISLSDTIVSSSSRGLRNHDNFLKPDIGAPGASVSAVAGTGDKAKSFGGTSGAAPMVAGAAALLKQVYGDNLLPQQYKALLMNSANNRIFQDITPQNPDGALVPVSRIGGGQVDLEEAINTHLIAWDVSSADPLTWTGSLSFQYQPIANTQTITRKLRILNMYHNERTVYLTPEFRYGNDVDMGVGITPSVESVTIPAGQTADVDIVMSINAADLRLWFDNQEWFFNIDRGFFGSAGSTLTDFEVDGYIYASACTGSPDLDTSACVSGISVPWHVLPKPVGSTNVMTAISQSSLTFTNASPAVDNNLDVFALVAQSPNDYLSTIGDCSSLGLDPGCNVAQPDIKEVGVRTGAFPDYLEFGVTFWNEPYYAGQFPVEVDIYIDTDRDGEDDYVVLNYDLGGATTGTLSGVNLVFVANLTTGDLTPVAYTDSAFDSNNYILPVPLAELGLAEGQSFNFQVWALDGYFTGSATDCAPFGLTACGYSTYTVGSPKYSPSAWKVTVPKASTTGLTYTMNSAAVSTQTGLLVMYREAVVGAESYAVRLNGSDLNAPFIVYVPIMRR